MLHNCRRIYRPLVGAERPQKRELPTFRILAALTLVVPGSALNTGGVLNQASDEHSLATFGKTTGCFGCCKKEKLPPLTSIVIRPNNEAGSDGAARNDQLTSAQGRWMSASHEILESTRSRKSKKSNSSSRKSGSPRSSSSKSSQPAPTTTLNNTPTRLSGATAESNTGNSPSAATVAKAAKFGKTHNISLKTIQTAQTTIMNKETTPPRV